MTFEGVAMKNRIMSPSIAEIRLPKYGFMILTTL